MGVFYGRALTAGGGGTSTTERLEFTYTGQYNERLEDGVVELLTDGVLKFKKEAAIDAFLVGGGSGGCSGWYKTSSNYGGGGGGAGGFTKTLLNIIPRANLEYEIVIGTGGSAGSSKFNNNDALVVTSPTNGGDTVAFGATAGGGKVSTAITPGSSLPSAMWQYLICGGSGGSGGGQSVGRGITSSYDVAGAGGSDGSDGGAANPQPNATSYPIGTGQGTTTREFGEAAGKLYAGGGGAGNILGTPTSGGDGGGGNGGSKMTATPNTGGGGGGANEGSVSTGGDGGSGIVCIRLHKKEGLQFNYTGLYNKRPDGVVELLTSGTFNLLKEAVVDIFAVGGGGGGAASINAAGTVSAGGAGGGGYTTTALGIELATRDYEITIGAGGANLSSSSSNGHDGENSMFDSLVIANGGKGGISRINGNAGGDGGSGGAAGYSGSTTTGGVPASGGSDGSAGGSTSDKAGGSGQGTTTREFGEPLGKLYAGGGGGANTNGSASGGPGGLGGGGAGGYGTGTEVTNGSNGKANTGGGGGAGGGNPSSGYGVGGAGGSGIVCVRLHKEEKLDFTYTGDYTEREDGVIELRSSGTFVPARDYEIDTFHVGGGAGGDAVTAAAGGFGGGSGYTKTQRNVSIKRGQQYIITVGLGGSGKAAGGSGAGDPGGVSSGFFDASGSIISANGGSGNNGGSGGGAGGHSTLKGAVGGTNGSSGGAGAYGPGGTGQGTNTYEFGEESTDPLKLYAGGGSGGSYYDVSGSTSGGARGGGNGNGGNGEANTGGGGGGGRGHYPNSDIFHKGGTGGSGIICIRLTPSA